MNLYPHQIEAIQKLRTGSILMGGVGSGKSRVALAYYDLKEKPKDLYIITTAKKRDSSDWHEECALFSFCLNQTIIVVDSWNNLHKYKDVKDAFFIFDEQRVVGSGAWVKSFIKVSKSNAWILLSATPGDTWMDYIPVFIANGFYKNRTEFIRRHVVYNNFAKFPKVDHYVEESRLYRLRDAITIKMPYQKKTVAHDIFLKVPFDKDLFDTVWVKRWNFYDKEPIKDVSALYYLMRKVVNSDPRRIDILGQLFSKHPRIIVFYNFNYERDLLLELGNRSNFDIAEWSGHKHEPLPSSESWMYIVQYAAGAEGWNCVETDTIVFYSQNYSYKMIKQAAGRIDRLNTLFTDLYYYHFYSTSYIDLAIQKSYKNKQNFNEKRP